MTIGTSQGIAWGFPRNTSGKESTSNAGDIRDEVSIPGLGRSPGGGNGNPLQYSCLENPMEATVHRVAELDVTEVTIHMQTRNSLFLDNFVSFKVSPQYKTSNHYILVFV